MNRLKFWICILLFCVAGLVQAESSRKAIAVMSSGSCELLDLDSKTIQSGFSVKGSRTIFKDAVLVEDQGTINVYIVADGRLNHASVIDNAFQGGCIEEEYIVDGLLYDQKAQSVAGVLRLASNPKSDFPDGQGKLRFLSKGEWKPTQIEDCVFIETHLISTIPGKEYTCSEMKGLFPLHADRMPEKNRASWVLVGQSQRLSTFYLFKESDGLTECYVLIADRADKSSRFYHFKPSGSLFTYGDIVLYQEETMLYDAKSRMYSEVVYSGKDRVYFAGKPDWIPCKVGEGMRHLYVYEGKAYFKKGVDIYSVGISPSGCGSPEKVLTLPFEPERFFVFESPKPSKPGTPLPKSASEVKIRGPVFDTKDIVE